MGTLTQDATTAQSLFNTLQTAANATTSTYLKNGVTALGTAMAPAISTPGSVTQAIADNIGAKMRAVDGYAQASLSNDARIASANLHTFLAQTFVDHYDSTLVFGESAGWPAPYNEPQSGGKHKPSPS